ncbi:MAG TPA: lytic transglycosylase domain-containing protein [Puia sp.]|nr:lytic transglycosylase domain-containing protein [Puia sp.]
MKINRILLLSVSLCIVSFVNARDGIKRSKATAPTHTARKHSSLLTHTQVDSLKGLENGFSNLFVSNFMVGESGAKLNPKAISFVQEYMEQNTRDLESMKKWGKPYFSMIDVILTKYGLPCELKYLAVIESELKPTATSWAGAVGPWQLMPGTARLLGLTVTRRYDERKNYDKSTVAAAKYLRSLYSEFGDWLLVIAAYNGGDGNVLNAIKRSGSQDFWRLQYYLPTESRNHVKKFIATHYIFEGQGGVTTLTKKEAIEQLSGSSMYVFHRNLSKEEIRNLKTMAISGKYCSSVIARTILMDSAEFNRYNPEFDKIMAGANNTYDLKLPSDKMDLFQSGKYQILTESVQQMVNAATSQDSAAQPNLALASSPK